MTTLAMTVPVARRSASRIPRRDLLLDSSDTLTLALTLVASDRPGAAPVDIAGLGPQLRLVVWHLAQCWDYGRPWPIGALAWQALAVTEPDTSGRATVTIPQGAARRWGRHAAWSLQLERLGDAAVLLNGALHVTHGAGLLVRDPQALLDDAGLPITDDAGLPIEV